MAKIFLDHITKVFDERVVAVDDMTLEIPDKKLASLLGPSGCGKTTTMRIISGLETPNSGRVYFDDQDVTNVPTEERDVAMVFQFPVLYQMSVFDNIAFPLKMRKAPKVEITERVKEAAELLGISSILRERPKALDVSMRQKVVLAKAFIRRPNVYLLDEPLTNVDPATRVELRARIKEIQRELGQTIIFVTHDQAESMTLADRIAVMNKGRLLQYDTPENIYSKPADTFVAWFVGNPGMNFINCSFKEKNGQAFLDAGTFTYNVTHLADIIKSNATSDELILGIRPEHAIVDVQKKGVEWVPSKCVLIEPFSGDRVIAHLQMDDQVIRIKTPISQALSEGRKLWIRLPSSHIHIFDKKTNKLIV